MAAEKAPAAAGATPSACRRRRLDLGSRRSSCRRRREDEQEKKEEKKKKKKEGANEENEEKELRLLKLPILRGRFFRPPDRVILTNVTIFLKTVALHTVQLAPAPRHCRHGALDFRE